MGESSTEGEWVKTTTTPTAKHDIPRDLVLNKEKMLMKLNENIIVRNTVIDTERTFANIRNM
jgi:hypothetical protein